MEVTHIPCGPFANASERIAYERVRAGLSAEKGDDRWFVLTDLALSATHRLLSDTVDIVVIGPPGVRIVEVKHLTADWVATNPEEMAVEADRVAAKARKIEARLRKQGRHQGEVGGSFLLTKVAKRSAALKKHGPIRGIPLHSLEDWKEAAGFNGQHTLPAEEAERLCRLLEPREAKSLDEMPAMLAGHTGLTLETGTESGFHRIFRAKHATRQEAVVLHLYDLSASDDPKAADRAPREWQSLQRLQQHSWAPRIIDSYQPVPGYRGELFFFTLVDPVAPTIEERSEDESWDTQARVEFARDATVAVREMHESGGESPDKPMLHRGLSPRTILVRHDNTPILTGFKHARIPTDITVASQTPVGVLDDFVAPEVRNQGIGAADLRSDVYAVCASLDLLFRGRDDVLAVKARETLMLGHGENPDARPKLAELEETLSALIEGKRRRVEPSEARYWSEDQIITFRHRDYRIVSKLGSGGAGTVFKVVRIDKETGDDAGDYVAKVVHDEDVGKNAMRAYGMIHSLLARNAGLSAIFDVADEWRDNGFVALMTWIEGTPIYQWIGQLGLLAGDEDYPAESAEGLAVRWLVSMCKTLGTLHDNGFVHGDVSPKNIILSEGDLVLTDYDCVVRTGSAATSLGTILYCSPSTSDKSGMAPSDDLYALAATMFHVLYDREPFIHGTDKSKARGLCWDGLRRDEHSRLTAFFDRATNPDPSRRFPTAAAALEVLTRVSTEVAPPEGRKRMEVTWLKSLLQSYPGSRWGNSETRGLDSEFAESTYIATELEETLREEILGDTVRLAVLCGNAGDGKTALLQHLVESLELETPVPERIKSDQRIFEGRLKTGKTVRINFDGSASWKGRSSDSLLDEFLAPFQSGRPSEDAVHLLAINDGRLLEWIGTQQETPLTKELSDCLRGKGLLEGSHIHFVNLNHRSLVGTVTSEKKCIDTSFLDRLVDALYGGSDAATIWRPCLSCTAQDHCEVFRATRLFGPLAKESTRKWARKRLFAALQASHLRGETHITVRELRAALVYILFGMHYCSEYHGNRVHSAGTSVDEHGAGLGEMDTYAERAFSSSSYGRQGELLSELPRFDPALEAHPRIDRKLLKHGKAGVYSSTPRSGLLESARRRAYFEWEEEDYDDLGKNDPGALMLAQGRQLVRFRDLALEKDVAELTKKVCGGISRLETLPPRALMHEDTVPLKIRSRTPTETAFWVEKRLSDFRLEPVTLEHRGMEWLHREARLVYTYRDGRKEELPLGADLFHLLLEIADGLQLGDVASDDTFARLSIFVQRLVREDERRIFAWNPRKEDAVHTVSAQIKTSEGALRQSITIKQSSEGVPSHVS